MSEWQPFASAPRTARVPFFALNHDREIWVAAFDERGRLMFRTNGRYEPRKFEVRNIDGERLLKEDEAFAKAGECWQNQWCFWSRLYEFKPTHWLPLPKPPASTAEDVKLSGLQLVAALAKASADTLPKGRDAKQARCASKGSAVAESQTPKAHP